MIGVGMPHYLKLELFGALVRLAFPGCDVYLVGSAATSKQWRDVDVRCLLTRSQWRRYVGEPGDRLRAAYEDVDSQVYYITRSEQLSNAFPVGKRRTAITLAFAELAREMTDLPVDFQFQTIEHANSAYRDGKRYPLGLVVSSERPSRPG